MARWRDPLEPPLGALMIMPSGVVVLVLSRDGVPVTVAGRGESDCAQQE
jgi:hypothetical protein